MRRKNLNWKKNRNVMVTAWIDGKNAGHMEGFLEGEQAKALAIARNLLSVMSDTDIAQATGLDKQVIVQLRSDAH